MWIQVPELSTGIDRRDAKAGSAIFERQMSPFEAYLISDLLLYQKRFNAIVKDFAGDPNAILENAEPRLNALKEELRKLFPFFGEK